MRTRFIFILSFLLFSSWAHALDDNIVEYREIPIKGKGSGTDDDGLYRSIRIPARVFIEDNVLTINFIVLVENVHVKVTNTFTGEVVYLESHNRPQSIEIDLSGEFAGKYQLELSLTNCNWLGDVYLE